MYTETVVFSNFVNDNQIVSNHWKIVYIICLPYERIFNPLTLNLRYDNLATANSAIYEKNNIIHNWSLIVFDCIMLGHSSAETAVSDTAVNIGDKDTVWDATNNIIGTYTDLNDGSTLTIDNRTNSEPQVNISLFRLTDIEGGIAKISDGTLTFTATDAAGKPIGGRITFDGDTAHLTFTESSWEYLPEGTSYSFVRGAKVDYEPQIL